jgi:hypothetical protein
MTPTSPAPSSSGTFSAYCPSDQTAGSSWTESRPELFAYRMSQGARMAIPIAGSTIIDAGTASSSPFQRMSRIVRDQTGIVFMFRWNPRRVHEALENRDHDVRNMQQRQWRSPERTASRAQATPSGRRTRSNSLLRARRVVATQTCAEHRSGRSKPTDTRGILGGIFYLIRSSPIKPDDFGRFVSVLGSQFSKNLNDAAAHGPLVGVNSNRRHETRPVRRQRRAAAMAIAHRATRRAKGPQAPE